jgi:hypothetical protein
MALHRPCKAAFSLTPRWRKRVDGKNVYDGQPPAETLEKLYLHDHRAFREDFSSHLTRRESLRLTRRELKYRLFLSLRAALRSNAAARIKIPVVIAPLRLIVRRMIN